MIRLLLASGREVDTLAKSIAGSELWHNTTAAEVAREGENLWFEGESEEEAARRTRNYPLIAELLDFFDLDPATTRQQLRELPELRDTFISDLFALAIFLCDDFLTVSAESAFTSTTAARFFQIAQRLPMELQMLLCNSVFGNVKNSVLSQHSEPAFKKLGRQLATSGSL